MPIPPSRFQIACAIALVLAACAPEFAAEATALTSRGALASPGAPHEMRVLSLRYFPLNASGQVDAVTTAAEPPVDVPLDVMRARVSRLLQDTVDGLNAGSRYRGYSNATAPASLHYSVIEDREFLKPIPASSRFFPTYDHQRMFADETIGVGDICYYVDGLGVKEVWIWGYHREVRSADGGLLAGSLIPEESDMAPKRGGVFGSPGYRDIANNTTGADDLPRCNSTYVVFDFNYFAGAATLHNHGHQMERYLGYINAPLADSFFHPWGQNAPAVNACGDVHQPPNAAAAYDYTSARQVLSNCEDWHPDGSGAAKLVSCSSWWPGGNCGAADPGAVERAEHVWWMQNMPGLGNTLTLNGAPMFNWWDIVGNFDAYSGPAPTVSVNTTYGVADPGGGNGVGGLFTYRATATSPFNISRVEFTLAGLPKQVRTAAPFEASFDSTQLCNGEYPWSVTAFDSRSVGQLSTGPGGLVQVFNVANEPPLAGLNVAITSAAPNTVFYSRQVTLQLALTGSHPCTQAKRLWVGLESRIVPAYRLGSGPVVFTDVPDGPQTAHVYTDEGAELLSFNFLVDFDPDQDGFSTLVERYVGTDPYSRCGAGGVGGWPADLNNVGGVNAIDQMLLARSLLTAVGQPGYNRRFDLNADGRINSIDQMLLSQRFGKSCLNP